ncbi:MAG: glycosyltransferase [Magnetococcus sp. WYHC-3]
MDLSVIIPARNEIFLQKTIEDILSNIEADTEIIAICDGYWPDPPVKDHDRVTIIHHKSIGQRAATNEGVRLSQAKYIMKADAHCAFDKGFDRKLIQDCQPDWTMIPMMWNLHAFDWVCKCGERTYQGNKPETCKCGSPDFKMDLVWKPRGNKVTVSWRFDKNLQFQYWKKHAKRPEAKGDIIDTMSFIGACWFMERQRYWDLDGLDEKHGSWGQVGTEMSCKTWLSGGRLVTTKKTWFAHMFRTGNFRGSGFGGSSFPYPLFQQDVDKARAYSQDYWRNDRWPKAKYKLEWLIEKFKPIPDWHE